MEAFEITLANGAILSGHVCVPKSTEATPINKPLIVATHGGTMSSQYFDATSSTSAFNPAAALGVPFVAISRPGYGDTTTLPLEPPQTSTWHQEEGRYLHEYILPAIWKQYARPAGATCIILQAHSLGSPAAIVAAALSSNIHAANIDASQHAYTLGGIILSGWGVKPVGSREQSKAMIQDKTWTDRLGFPDRDMFLVALYGTPEQDLVDAEIRDHKGLGSHGFSYGEFVDGALQWSGYWKEKYASKVNVPVCYAMGGGDLLWSVSKESVDEFAEAFTAAKWIEKRIITGAPHCLEVSHWSRTWYLRCFAFAADCAAEVAASAVK